MVSADFREEQQIETFSDDELSISQQQVSREPLENANNMMREKEGHSTENTAVNIQ